MVIVGPRSVQHGEDYSVFLTARNYYQDEKFELTLTVFGGEEEIKTEQKKLGTNDDKITFKVKIITKKGLRRLITIV